MSESKYLKLCDKEWLSNRHLNQKQNLLQIATEVGCSRTTVFKALRRHNIPARSYSDSHTINQKKQIIINDKYAIEGLLLGDGHICHHRVHGRSRLCIAQKQKELVEYIRSFILPNTVIKYRDYFKGGKSRSLYTCDSGVSSIFDYYHYKWYQNKTKIVPTDLELSPVTVLFWYLGDGSFSHTDKSGPRIDLCTHGFTEKEVTFLQNLFNQININFRVIKQYQKIGNKKYGPYFFLNISCIADIIRFFDYIGPCPVECMKHRWPAEPLKYKFKVHR